MITNQLNINAPVDLAALSDIVDNMSKRALGILDLLGGQFTGEEDIDKVNDESVFWALESVSKEILDIQRTVESFYESNCLKC